MKIRIITSIFALIILFISMSFYYTPIFNFIALFVVIIAITELFDSIFEVKKLGFLLLSYTIPFFTIILPSNIKTKSMIYYIYFLFICNIVLLFFYNKDIKISELSLFIIFSLLMSLSISIVIIFRDEYKEFGILYTLLALSSAWFSDIGAYFFGYFFGKTKLCKNISPKKTVEGAIGGISLNLILVYLILIIFKININLSSMLIISLFASILGIMGDLTASVIKRQHNIKDFGNLMPGHGGIIDRFDSVFFTLPSVFVMLKIFNM